MASQHDHIITPLSPLALKAVGRKVGNNCLGPQLHAATRRKPPALPVARGSMEMEHLRVAARVTLCATRGRPHAILWGRVHDQLVGLPVAQHMALFHGPDHEEPRPGVVHLFALPRALSARPIPHPPAIADEVPEAGLGDGAATGRHDAEAFLHVEHLPV